MKAVDLLSAVTNGILLHGYDKANVRRTEDIECCTKV